MDENNQDSLPKNDSQIADGKGGGTTSAKQVIAVALIGLLGVVTAAVITSWDKLTTSAQLTNATEAQVAYGEARFTIVDSAIHQTEESIESQRSLALSLRGVDDARRLGEFANDLRNGRERVRELHNNYRIALRGAQWSTANTMRTLLNEQTMSLNRKLALLQEYFGPSSKRRFPTPKQLAKLHEAIHELKEIPPYGMLRKDGSQQLKLVLYTGKFRHYLTNNPLLPGLREEYIFPNTSRFNFRLLQA